MKDFYDSMGSILVFLVAVLLFQTFLGKRATTIALGLILSGQFLFNIEILDKFKFLGPQLQDDPSSGHGGILTNSNKSGGVILL